MPANKRDQAKEALNRLFEKLGIKRIICVDDVYALPSAHEEAIGLIEEIGPGASAPIIDNADIPMNQDRDVWVLPFIAWWSSIDESKRKLILQRLYAAQAGQPLANEPDLKAATALSELFSDQEFVQLSLSQWKLEQDQRIVESSKKRTLFLFDEDLSNDGGTTTGGRQLIKDVLASDAARGSMCGLLSHNIAPEREFEIWNDFKSAQYDFDAARVVPVSKGTLETKPLQFAQSIKLTVLNPDCHALAKLSGNLIRKSHASAQAQLEQLNVYSFDRIVFGASNREGIWEPDTLFRLHNLFQRIEARSRAKNSLKLRRLAQKIRSVSGIPTEAGSTDDRSDAWKIQRLELYENADYLNNHLTPIELGDIFEKTDVAETSQYILLAQPCDLMVRTATGQRSRLSHVVLAGIGYTRPSRERPDEFYELPHFDSNNDKSAYVRFTDTYSVSLDLLDLCAFNSDGAARIQSTDKSQHVVLAWQKRHAHVLNLYKELIKKRARIGEAINAFNEGKPPKNHLDATLINDLTPQFSTPELFMFQCDPLAESVAFNCRRTERLEPSHAAAMWTKCCNFNARAAFEVDFAK